MLVACVLVVCTCMCVCVHVVFMCVCKTQCKAMNTSQFIHFLYELPFVLVQISLSS